MAYLGPIFPDAKKLTIIRLGYSKGYHQPFFMIKQYPKIKFKIEQEKEIEIYFNFLRDARYHNLDREMRWAFYGLHSELKVLNKNLTKRQKEIILQNYIKKYYKKYIPLIKKGFL